MSLWIKPIEPQNNLPTTEKATVFGQKSITLKIHISNRVASAHGLDISS